MFTYALHTHVLVGCPSLLLWYPAEGKGAMQQGARRRRKGIGAPHEGRKGPKSRNVVGG